MKLLIHRLFGTTCLFFSLILNGYSQDTITVYFEFGSSKIDSEYNPILKNLSSTYDLSSLDSIQFIGYADSVGNVKSNIRLSKKRAKNVYKTCKPTISSDIFISVLAKGEDRKVNQHENRRVEVLLFFAKELPTIKEKIIEKVNPRCFLVDFEALSYCHIRTIKKRKKEYVQIEAMNTEIFTKQKHYYVVRGRK